MDSQAAINCEQVRKYFENRQAIYVEKGALRVRVKNIQANVAERWLTAQVEEITTPGLAYFSNRWNIGAGYLTAFSENIWEMGYGGWGLFFSEPIVQGVVELASQWPEHLDRHLRYNEVLRWLKDHHASEPTKQVFPDGSPR